MGRYLIRLSWLRSLTICVVCTISLTWALAGCDKAHSDSVRLTNLGMKALSAGDLREARIRFQEAVEIYPENAKAHYGLGVMLFEGGENDRAKQHLKEATKLDNQLTEAFYQLGAIALEESKADEAEQELRRALDLDPEHTAALFSLGQIHERRGELKQADRNYRQSVTLNPLSPQAFLALARLYQHVGAEEEAEAASDVPEVIALPDIEASSLRTFIPGVELRFEPTSTGECWYWRRGVCKRGDYCRFQHIGPAGPPKAG